MKKLRILASVCGLPPWSTVLALRGPPSQPMAMAWRACLPSHAHVTISCALFRIPCVFMIITQKEICNAQVLPNPGQWERPLPNLGRVCPMNPMPPQL